MKRMTIIWLSIILIIFRVNAQSGSLHGIVTDSITGEPLPFASLIFKGTTVGTSTDMDGRYSLPIPDRERTLEVSYLGYQTYTSRIRPHSDSRQLNIRLSPDGIALQEVVVKPQKEKYSKKDNPAVRFVKQLIERRKGGRPAQP